MHQTIFTDDTGMSRTFLSLFQPLHLEHVTLRLFVLPRLQPNTLAPAWTCLTTYAEAIPELLQFASSCFDCFLH